MSSVETEYKLHHMWTVSEKIARNYEFMKSDDKRNT